MRDQPGDDVWIDTVVSNHGIDSRFFGMATVSYPNGFAGTGPAVAVVKFNLTAYVKHLIEQSKQ